MKFRKMNGLGNDFVIIDGREQNVSLNAPLIAKMGSRHFGVGFDQLAVFERCDDADAYIRFWNSDGSQAGACGNATRCIADILLTETAKTRIALKTRRGVLEAVRREDGLVSVNMGQPQTDWREIPLAHDVDIDALPIDGAPSAVGMGNPHCVFFVDDVKTVALETLGARYEHDPLYPERTNVEFVEVRGRDNMRMRVWERGGMVTLACGSGTCASVVAAHRRGLVDDVVNVELDGGMLEIALRDDGVWMTGAVSYVFEGDFDEKFLSP